jgi:uncharacterized membrane protein YGL010W
VARMTPWQRASLAVVVAVPVVSVAAILLFDAWTAREHATGSTISWALKLSAAAGSPLAWVLVIGWSFGFGLLVGHLFLSQPDPALVEERDRLVAVNDRLRARVARLEGRGPP